MSGKVALADAKADEARAHDARLAELMRATYQVELAKPPSVEAGKRAWLAVLAVVRAHDEPREA